MSVYKPSSPVLPPVVRKEYRLQKGFTLIELLMVIAIIGILAGILIPVVGAVRKNAKIAASKVQLSAYVNAINMFKGEYKYYPFASRLDEGERLALNTTENSEAFIETLSARTTDTYEKTSGEGNRREIEFYEFSDNDYLRGDRTTVQIADRFDNTNIYILIDADGNGLIEGVPDPDDPSTPIDIRTKVSAYVESDGSNPDYYLYE